MNDGDADVDSDAAGPSASSDVPLRQTAGGDLGTTDLTHADVDDLLNDGGGSSAAEGAAAATEVSVAGDAPGGEIAELFAAAHNIALHQEGGGAAWSSSAEASSAPSAATAAGKKPSQPRRGRGRPRSLPTALQRRGKGGDDADGASAAAERKTPRNRPYSAAAVPPSLHVAVDTPEANAMKQQPAANRDTYFTPDSKVVKSFKDRTPIRDVSFNDVLIHPRDESLLCARGNARYRDLVFRKEDFEKAGSDAERRKLAREVVQTVRKGWRGAFLRRIEDGECVGKEGKSASSRLAVLRDGRQNWVELGKEAAATAVTRAMERENVGKCGSGLDGLDSAKLPPSEGKKGDDAKEGIDAAERKDLPRPAQTEEPDKKRKSTSSPARPKPRGRPKKRKLSQNSEDDAVAAKARASFSALVADAAAYNAADRAQAKAVAKAAAAAVKKKKTAKSAQGARKAPRERDSEASAEKKQQKAAPEPPPFLSPRKLRGVERLQTDPKLLEAHVERSKAAAALKRLDKPAKVATDHVAECRKRLEEALRREEDIKAKQREAKENLANAESAVAEAELASRCAWNGWYARLLKYKESNGHCAIPLAGESLYKKIGAVALRKRLESRTVDDVYTAKDDPGEELSDLSEWCALQRYDLDDVRPDPNGTTVEGLRRHLLDWAGFVWDAENEARWIWGLHELKKYKAETGKVGVSHKKGEKYYLLRLWLMWVRTRRRMFLLSDQQIETLKDLGVDFYRADRQWEDMYEKLKKFKEEHGTCEVERDDKANADLRAWARDQQRYFLERREGKQLRERARTRLAKLEAIGYEWEKYFSRFRPISSVETEKEDRKIGRYGSQWMSHYRLLCEFREERGHTNVKYGTEKNTKYKELTHWVSGIRMAYVDKMEGKGRNRSKRTLTDEQISLLEDIGFDWRPHDSKWKAMYAEVAAFSLEHGHCRVPHARAGRAGALFDWVKRQRKEYQKQMTGKIKMKENRGLHPERIKMLEDIGFEWEIKDFKDDLWDARLQELIEYKREHGDCNVPGNYPPNKKLSSWVRNQRMFYKNRFQPPVKGRTVMTDERMKILNAMEFEWRMK